ncbi:hypothetical protein I3843_01G108100 [Carya illinoinensis]|nr:hypothetical protein I3843_01G108100 [Carya illinoinensis]
MGGEEIIPKHFQPGPSNPSLLATTDYREGTAGSPLPLVLSLITHIQNSTCAALLHSPAASSSEARRFSRHRLAACLLLIRTHGSRKVNSIGSIRSSSLNSRPLMTWSVRMAYYPFLFPVPFIKY